MGTHELIRAAVRSAAVVFSFHAAVAVAQSNMLDYTFGDSGSVRNTISGSGGFNDRAYGVVIQPDGKIVAAGLSGTNGPHTEFAVARYDSDGSLDATFGTNGSTRIPISGSNGTDDEGYAVALQPDGKILVGGYAFMSSSAGVYFAVARFNTDGTLDGSFGNGGTATIPIGSNGLSEAYSIALQKDGKIVLGGYCESPPLNFTFAVARFDANGAIDGTFGGNGSVRTSMPNNRAFGYAVAIQEDGKIVLGGENGYQFAMVRYQSNGVVDSSFGTHGIVATTLSGSNGSNDLALAIAIQQDGRIVLAGRGDDTLSRFGLAVARYTIDGTPDSTFASTGSVITFINGGGLASAFGRSLGIQPDGKIVVVGSSSDTANHAEFAVARYDTDGTLDNSFGDGGTTRNPIKGGTGYIDGASSVALQKDGKLVVAGTSQDSSYNTVFALARYLSQNPAVAVKEEKAAVPGIFRLYQNYPNPFNPTTAIRYQLPAAGLVRLTVYNILGQEVMVLVNERKPAGTYEVNFDASGLSSGVYFTRLQAGSFSDTKKLLLIR